MDVQDILSLTVVALKDKLREIGLSVQGRKCELRDRLLLHFGHVLEDEDEDESESELRSVTMVEAPTSRQANIVSNPQFTLRDVEGSISLFNGTDELSIDKWLEEFEDNAVILNWSSLQQFVFARQLLRGAAKLFVRSQTGIRSFSSLKSALRSEFGVRPTSLDIHRTLQNRRKKNNESFREYLYTLIEIAKPVNLDEESLILYFIEGIPDSKVNKTVLYQARTIQELKEQLRVYERVHDSRQPSSREKSWHGASTPVEPRVERNCFNCGSEFHLANGCDKIKQIKCFKCGQIGHRQFECDRRGEVNIKTESKRSNALTVWSKSHIFKPIKMGDLIISALIDTGANVCLMRHDMYKCAGISKLSDNRLFLGGIKGSKVCTLGSFEANIEADGIHFIVTFHVTGLNDLPCEVIMGNDILNSINIFCSEKGAKFSRKELKGLNNEDSLETRHVCQSKNESNIVSDKEFKVTEVEDNAIASNLALTEFTALCEAFEEKYTTPDTASNLDLGNLNVKIQAIDDIPFYQTPTRVSCADQKRIDNWLSERQSNSEYASPVVLVLRKHGTKRIYGDFRKLKEDIIRNNFPMMTFQNWLKRTSVRYKEKISIDGRYDV
ncbi:uncharacterized protein LOC120769807 [Bactrocera tryoni]|uniref:uncharacterized protein LOC120769807 n=1 Tax=Bactrocera tryoni TaxID=59916 RepID=UPI001A95F404|nr:uncharacterized protein LOC120769807 [Bactrocera tryoni]